jgi:carbonic anhydrase
VDIRQHGTVEMDSALDGPPVRDIHSRTSPPAETLAHAQRPDTLFITCTDSRVVPDQITGRGPGDLFTVRNVGNLVPKRQTDASTEAALAFAVEKMGVSSIVVCGHSSCGAMHALLGGKPPRSEGERHLSRWLANGRGAVAAFDGGHPVARAAADAGFGPVDQLSMVNVALQVEALTRHPLIEAAYARGDLDVVGVFYDVASGNVLRIGPAAIGSFELVTASP